ncbi:hypothetical protein Tco_0007518 [Tanacetum coccineum]
MAAVQNPPAVLSLVLAFWATAKAKIINRERQIQALVDKKKVIITEKSVRSDLMLADAEGTECLPNDVIFEQLTLMGYENLTQKLTFYKAYFSSQWKFLIHTILQCLSVKTTAWNKFSSSMASAIICLATNQKFNFSKYIFDNIMKNLKGGVKFLMYPSGEDRLQLTELMSFCTKLQNHVLDLEEAKTAQAKEIASLKKRVKQLEKRRKSRTSGLKRLRKGRKIADLDDDAEVTLTDVLNGDEVFEEPIVNAAKTTSSIPFRTLIEIKAAKPKVVTTAATTITTDVASTRLKAKEIVFPNQKEKAPAFTPIVSSLQASQLPQVKDKGKEKMVEPKKPLKKKDQIALDEELALGLHVEEQAELERMQKERVAQEEASRAAIIKELDSFQAMIEVDEQLAARLKLKNKNNSPLKKSQEC